MRIPGEGSKRLHSTAIGSEYTDDEREFLMAVEKWRRKFSPYPAVTDFLKIAKALGYRKVGSVERNGA